MIIHLLIFGIVMYFILRWINKKFPYDPPNDDAAFISMCCRRLKTNVTEVFKIAAAHDGINLSEKMIAKDVKLYLHGETAVPPYMRRFIDEGRKELNNGSTDKV